jgi:hypothetical protein
MAEVGIALAVLPLVIAAAEHYSKAASAFSKYRCFTAELSYLSIRIKVQRAIFKDASKRLISVCVGHEEAERMLEDPEHSSWTDPIVERAFARRLGNCLNVLIDCLHLINNQLTKLENECQRFEDVNCELQVTVVSYHHVLTH